MHEWPRRRGRAYFPTKSSILNALFRVICKAGLKHCFWFGDLITFSLRFFFGKPNRRTSPETSCHRWQPISVFGFFVCFSLVVSPIKGTSSQWWSDSKLEQTWTWLPLTQDSPLVTTLPTQLSILVSVFFSVLPVLRLLLFLHPVVAFFLFCWFWADLRHSVF